MLNDNRTKTSKSLYLCCQERHPEHRGSLSTGHANSCLEMLERLTGMVMAGSSLPYDAIMTQLSMGIDIMIHITRDRNGRRYVDEICSVLPARGKEFCLLKLFINEGGDNCERVCTAEELKDTCTYKG